MELKIKNECTDEVKIYAKDEYIYAETLRCEDLLISYGFIEIELELSALQLDLIKNNNLEDNSKVLFALNASQAKALGIFLLSQSFKGLMS